MAAEVLYRKWRPRTFAELAGQEAVVRTLTNAVASGKVSHAYLFSGPRGTGKTTTGRLLAKAVNCAAPKDGDPCNECESCRAHLEGRAFDWLIELDAASNRGIDEIRNLRDKANFHAPVIGGDTSRVYYKVYLVDEVHMLTEPAFNALLKTLEEPPAHVIFVLATTEAHKVPATVVSRCQRFDFRRIPLSASVDRMAFIAGQEQIECPREALEVIARTATGSLRDAINLLEQLVDSYGKSLSIEQVQEGLGLVVDARSGQLALHALRGELAGGLGVIASVRDDGLDLRQFQRQVVGQLRGLLLAKSGAAPTDSWSEEQLVEMRAQVEAIPAERLIVALRAFGEADLRADPLSPLPLELALASTTLASAPSAAPPPPARPEARPAPPPLARAEARPVPPPAAAPPRPAPPAKPAARTVPKRPPPQETAASNGEAPAVTVAQAAPVSGEVSPDLAEARARWPQINERARELQFRAAALLNSGCGIIEATRDEIVFGFRYEIHFNRMQGDGGENLRALQQAVDEVLGQGRRVRCVLDENVEQQRTAPRGGHLVRAAQELGGEMLPGDG
jgi:DNA polymerase-3 subunit gamma/tau